MAKILVVDDDIILCKMFTDRLTRLDHEAVYVTTLTEAKQRAFAESFDLIFLDVQMPDGNGLTELPKLRQAPSLPDVIIITGQGNPDGAELAIKSGAWDYLEKSTAVRDMLLPLARALEYRAAKATAGRQTKNLNRTEIIGNSGALNKCLEQVATVASCEANVLITGETGVGKELFAKIIHQNSNRSAQNFVVVDCASLPESLVESTLFGHEKGAFTGADTAKAGLLKQADGGTLFLDEIGDMELPIQKKFLRALQEQRFRPVGSNSEVTSKFRLIAATNKDLASMAQNDIFRPDLLFRLKVMDIELPPLRDRREDITDIAISYVNRLSIKYGLNQKGFAPDFLETIMEYPWPGNVRELLNAIEVALHNGQYEPLLFAKHLPDTIRVALLKSQFKNNAPSPYSPPPSSSGEAPLLSFKTYRNNALALAEKEYLQHLVRQTRGNIKTACTISNLGRTRLYTLMKKYDISRLGWDN